MVSSINTALLGLSAASKRLEVSANNIANQFSTKSVIDGKTTDAPYKAQRVDQVSLSNGGVLAKVSDANPPTTSASDGQGGTAQQSNVDPANELIQQNIAAYDFKANLKTIQTQDNILKNLLDIVS